MLCRNRAQRLPVGATAGFSGQQASGRLANAASARASASGTLATTTPGKQAVR